MGACHGQLWVHGMDNCGCMSWATVGAWHGQLWMHVMDNCGCMSMTTVGVCHGYLWVHVIKVLIKISNRDHVEEVCSDMWQLLPACVNYY